MSALDRAIIKAYHRPAARPAAQPAETLVPAKPVATAPAVPLSQALADLAVQTRVDPSEPISTSLGALLDEALQPEPVETQPSDVAHPPVLVPARHEVSPAMPPEPANVPTSPPSHRAAATKDTNTIAAAVQLPTPPAQDVTAGSAAKAWCPMLQVDRVVWPAIHNRLQGAAQAAIAQMTDGLHEIASSGRKIIGLASCGRGEGVTTLLSAAARNLLGRGKKVVLVDNHWSNPQLARCLGLLPQIGWEESLSGGLPLEEIVIESLADGLAVLPVREPPASAITKAKIAASLETLVREFDLVLVDLGPVEEMEDKSTPAHDVAARMDAVVLVQNVRSTPPHRLAEVRTRLSAAKMPYAGTIQNFVAG
jgi:Mrp family chromosome partitioning ATPase